jgi:N-carbamoyl-L-amino-acid hydrolase
MAGERLHGNGYRFRVNGDRLLRNLERLRGIGATAQGGVSRLAFTAEDIAGRDAVSELMAAADLEVRLDPAANLIGTRPGGQAGAPMLLSGSHLDTVVDGGPYDGVYGVLAAIEVLQTLAERGVRLKHPAGVIAFSNEEGAFGTTRMWGSRALTGALSAADLASDDLEGIPMAEMLSAAGWDTERIGEAAWPPGSVAAYLELHIEQGPVLHRLSIPIGVVEAISGQMNLDVLVEGTANHTATTPMAHRHDALVAAARLILAVNRVAAEEGVVRAATVDTVSVRPNVGRVIPGEVHLGAEVCDADQDIDRAVQWLSEAAARIARTTDTRIRITSGDRSRQVSCDPRLRQAIARSAERLGLRHISLPSGASHDAQMMARIAPIGMIFVPSRDGTSHTPDERTDPEHLIAGADVLLATFLGLDRTTISG